MGLTDQRQKAKNITDYRQNAKKITDYRDEDRHYLYFFFQKEEYIAFFQPFQEVTKDTMSQVFLYDIPQNEGIEIGLQSV